MTHLTGLHSLRRQRPVAEPLSGSALLVAIRSDLTRLSPKLRNVASYCLGHAGTLHRERIQDVAERAGTIPSSVVRLAQRYGYGGFQDLKLAFLPDQQSAPVNDEVAHHHASAPEWTAALSDLESTAAGILALRDLVLSAAFRQAVCWVGQARRIQLVPVSEADRAIANHLLERLSVRGLHAELSDRARHAAPADLVIVCDLEGACGNESADVLPAIGDGRTAIHLCRGSDRSAGQARLTQLVLDFRADAVERLMPCAMALCSALCEAVHVMHQSGRSV